MIERLPVAVAFMIIGLICYVISQRPVLSKKEEKELQELDNEISRLYGGKK
ncbi:hypothetical protein [Clostridium cadaveris]|uniref:hypothetical protein n=1 Tax=Clostridium cadaveris TaxID=1529 RepID=UPI00399F561A